MAHIMTGVKCRLCCLLAAIVPLFMALILIQLFTLEDDNFTIWEGVWEQKLMTSSFLRDFRQSRNKKPKAIVDPILLWWTPFGVDRGQFRRCGRHQCFITQDRSFEDHPKTEVFMFYGSDFNPTDMPVPRRLKDQWALFHEESPKNKMIFNYGDAMQLFNHTATFRQESDFPLTLQYLKNLDSLVSQKYFVPLQKKNILLKKFAPILYIHSDCDTPSGRDVYVKELMKHVPVDSYGTCLHNKDLPEHLRGLAAGMEHEDLLKIVAQYKFTLAFENAVCEDYITEKLWRPLTVGSVPVYFGAPNILEWLPNDNSAIIVDEFKDPADLAAFLKQLNKNDTWYNEFLVHKLNGSVANEKLLSALEQRRWGIQDEADTKGNFVEHFECFICERVQMLNLAKHIGLSPIVYRATQSHYGCPSPRFPNTYNLQQTWWAELYDKARVEALVLRQLVANNTNFTSKEYHDKINYQLKHANIN